MSDPGLFLHCKHNLDVYLQIQLSMNDSVNIKELNDRIKQESEFVDLINLEMKKVIVGQKQLLERL